MKSLLLRMMLVLLALLVLVPAVSTNAEFGLDEPFPSDSSLYGSANRGPDTPWWELCPPRVRTRTRVVTRTPETMIESIDAEGYCYTAIKQVNVRSKPSIYATKVQTIRSARTEFTVSARVKNSSGEIWYAVLLANGTLGYIRSDLLNTDHVILLDDPYAYEEEETTKAVAASESASDVLNIVRDEAPAQPEPTPQVIYVTPAPAREARPTPTPIIIYVTPEPEVTPQVIYITQE